MPLVAAAVAGLTAAIVGGSPPVHAAAGQPFTSLQAPYTQALFGTSSAFLGGIAFAPNGDVWANECQFSVSPLHRYVRATSTLVHNTAVHPSSLVASNAGCGMVNHPDGKIYSNTSEGLARLDPASGAPIDVVGARGNALGVAVDPQSRAVVYVAEDCRSSAICTIARYDPAAGTSSTFAVVPGSTSTFVDGLAFDPSGQFLMMSTRARMAALRSDTIYGKLL